MHAWGNPAVVLSCGVPRPAGYSATTSQTAGVDGISWFQQVGTSTVVWTAVRPSQDAGETVYVRLAVPTHYQDQGSFLVDLVPALKSALP